MKISGAFLVATNHRGRSPVWILEVSEDVSGPPH